MPEYSIDEARLYRILDDGQAASSTMRGLGTEIEALRVETGKLETGMLAAQRGTLSDRPDPATARRLASQKEQLKRAQARQSEAHEAHMPRLDLARRVLSHARANGLRSEVSGYAY